MVKRTNGLMVNHQGTNFWSMIKELTGQIMELTDQYDQETDWSIFMKELTGQ
jgi:hypothetical protein